MKPQTNLYQDSQLLTMMSTSLSCGDPLWKIVPSTMMCQIWLMRSKWKELCKESTIHCSKKDGGHRLLRGKICFLGLADSSMRLWRQERFQLSSTPIVKIIKLCYRSLGQTMIDLEVNSGMSEEFLIEYLQKNIFKT